MDIDLDVNLAQRDVGALGDPAPGSRTCLCEPANPYLIGTGNLQYPSVSLAFCPDAVHLSVRALICHEGESTPPRCICQGALDEEAFAATRCTRTTRVHRRRGNDAVKLGIGSAETVRTWNRMPAVDAGQCPGVASEEAAEIKRLKAEERRAEAGQRDPQGGLGFRGRARPAVEALVAFIDEHWQVFGVEPMYWRPRSHPGDRAAGHGSALAVQLPRDLPHPVDAEVVGVDAADLHLQLRIPHRPR